MSVRCVIVDDDSRFLQSARTLLEREGLQVIGVASTGAEAVRCATDLHPDVTLVDVHLGEESGIEVSRRLVDDPRLDPGRLILISAYAEEDLVDLIEESPAIGFLGKPELSAAAVGRLLRAAGEGQDHSADPPP